jgi:transcriptional regulator with XRE-family HTH domain
MGGRLHNRLVALMPRSRNSPRQARLLEMLAAHRIAANLSQEEIARRLGRPQSFVSKYELGERRLDVVELLEVCAALGVDVRYVIRELLKVAPG